MAVLHCNIVVNDVGVEQYVPFALEDDKSSTLINDDNIVAFNVFANGEKMDLRSKPPFYPLTPCPYCGTRNDRKHATLQHINSKHGVLETEVKKFGRENNISEHHAFIWLAFGEKRW